MTLQDITDQAQQFAVAHTALANEVAALNRELDGVKRRHIDKIRRLVNVAATRKATLHTAIESTPELFCSPRTYTVDGIKFGLAKQKGVIEFDDSDAVVVRIRKIYSDDETKIAALIHTKETPNKVAMKDLPVAEVKRLGCTVTADGDKVVIVPVSGEVDKIVAALLKDATEDTLASSEAA
jgi:hypothetical protein